MEDKERAIEKHRQKRGKLQTAGKVSLTTKEDLSDYYTPGVAYVSLAIKDDVKKSFDLTMRGRTAAIITDGTRILGLGNVGPEAGMPVMEGKALLLKKLAGVDAIPICLKTTDEDEIVKIVQALEPTFGAINIEDIQTPKCINIVERLTQSMGIPNHDDSKGMATVALAALNNALKLAGKKLGSSRIVINGAGAAGVGIAELLSHAGAKSVYLVDTKGIVYKGRPEDMNPLKDKIAAITNPDMMKGPLEKAAGGADVLIAASVKGAFDAEIISAMASKPIVFALANPYPGE